MKRIVHVAYAAIMVFSILTVISSVAKLIGDDAQTKKLNIQTGKENGTTEETENRVGSGLVAGVTNVQYNLLRCESLIGNLDTQNVDSNYANIKKNDLEKHTAKESNEIEDVDGETDTIDEDELYMLSHLIYGEGGNEYYPDDLRYYVGSVVLNRMASDRFPSSMEAVIFQDGQYACTWHGTYYDEPTERCVRIARELLENGSMLPANVVYQAEFKQGDGTYTKVGNTYFCYIND